MGSAMEIRMAKARNQKVRTAALIVGTIRELAQNQPA